MITPYHAKYYANKLTQISGENNIDKLSMSLMNSTVDINPHQIESALFALKSPLSKGAILADEVGLGKTIEAGLVLCQYWAEVKRKLLVICPASLRKQWGIELMEKFNLPSIIIDSNEYQNEIERGSTNPFEQDSIVIISINFASSKAFAIEKLPWDLVIIDEAHKLRNVYKESNKMARRIKNSIKNRKKLLLTATPLQNNISEIYGLSTIIDDMIFGSKELFKQVFGFMSLQGRANELFKDFVTRTLRKQVIEYIPYTKRNAVTINYEPSKKELSLYESISKFLYKPHKYSIPEEARILLTMIIRKLLGSSTRAVESTLLKIRDRLIELRENGKAEIEIKKAINVDELIIYDETDQDWEELKDRKLKSQEMVEAVFISDVDQTRVKQEISEIEELLEKTNRITTDTKSSALLKAIDAGFVKLNEMGAEKKALIFTESRKTQEYLRSFLDMNGYEGKTVIFNGTNEGEQSNEIYQRWLEENKETGKISGVATADRRLALIEYFKDKAEVMIATEAISEGMNLQFCSLVINYDLPWNPQRIEQRIGRCHRYGQKYDVVVINFLNTNNQVECRLFELLEYKLGLFDGVFGSTDSILGAIESGIDFDSKINEIYQTCRTSEEIDEAFNKLQQKVQDKINDTKNNTTKLLFENFDEDVGEKLKLSYSETQNHLNSYQKMLWETTKFVLRNKADFNQDEKSFNLQRVTAKSPVGKYQMISIDKKQVNGGHFYRLSNPLSKWVLNKAQKGFTPIVKLIFNASQHPTVVSAAQELIGRQGFMCLKKVIIDSINKQEFLVFSAADFFGNIIDQEICEKLFRCYAKVEQIDTNKLIKSKAIGDCVSIVHKESDGAVSRAIAKVDENNKSLFVEEQEKLQNWMNGTVELIEKELEDVKAEIRTLQNKCSKYYCKAEEKLSLQKKVNALEKKKNALRNKVYKTENEALEVIEEKMKQLEKRMEMKTSTENLFFIFWEVA